MVTVDRGETRVAMLEAEGDPAPVKTTRRRRHRKGDLPPGWRVSEVYFERRGSRSIVGNIYKGKVDNVLPGLEAAFVDLGLDKNGFLHVDEIVLPGVETVRRGRGSGPRITDLLRPGQDVVVQVVKDPLKSKGARLSMELTIAGRYMVYAPTGEGVGVSKRLEDPERQRLRKEAKQLDLNGGGAIIRTAAHGANRPDFERELQYLFKLNDVLHKRVEEATAPALVFQEADLSVRVVRDIFSAHLERAIVDDEKQHQRLMSFFSRTAPELVERVSLWEDEDASLFEAFGVEPVIDGMISRRVDLPSGGYLMIDYAEALTVIDVNTGSFTGKGRAARLEDTITRTNLEAADEVVRQLRLRDIGGIIVIDFIDMARTRNRDAVLKTLRKALDEDRTKTFVVEISPLGLVEMTRQNVTEGVREIMTKACPICHGEGVVKSEETIAIELDRRLRRIAKDAASDGPAAYLVRVNPRVSQQFLADGAQVLHQLEAETGRYFHFEGSDGLPLDHFAITMEGELQEIEKNAVPFNEGEEVHVDVVEPHMYNDDDAVAKVDGYVIEVINGIPFVGEKKLVRIEEAGRTAARAALLGDDADTAAQAAEERERQRARARRAAPRRRKAPEPVAPLAVATKAPPVEAEPAEEKPKRRRRSRKKAEEREPAAAEAAAPAEEKPKPRRRSRKKAEPAATGEAASSAEGEPAKATPARKRSASDDAEPAEDKPKRRRSRRKPAEPAAAANGQPGAATSGQPDERAERAAKAQEGGESASAADGDGDGLQSSTRRRGRRGGRRRSRAKAADVPEATE